MKKISNAIEANDLKATIKRLLWEFSYFPSFPVTVLLIAEKLLSLWLQNIQTFSLFLLIALWKIKRNCMSGLAFFRDLLEVGKKKKHFLNFVDFRPFNVKIN